MKWFLLLLSTALYANDGAFFGSGNHLVPIRETDISVQKEILYLKKIQNKIYRSLCVLRVLQPQGGQGNHRRL